MGTTVKRGYSPGEFCMDIKKITEEEKSVLYIVADEYQDNGVIKQICPRCGGKLQYIGNRSSYRIFCERECGIIFNVRGI